MSYLNELKQLAKLLFSGTPKKTDTIEIIQMKHFPMSGYVAMSWCGKLITRENPENITKTTFNHEMIHLKQSQQYGSWVSYYWKYLKEWIKGQPFKKPSKTAYYTIPFEMEAYANENNMGYCDNYNPDNITKYYINKRRKTFNMYGSFNKWFEYIKTL